jgi:hypothetical protein
MVNKDIISVGKTEFITNCEIEWVSIKLKNNKDLLIGCYYMQHRNSKDIEELERSVNLTLQGNNNNIMLGGDFNCPDIDWSNLHVKSQAHDIDVQKAVIDITTNIGMTQVHNEPMRENNLLDLIFTMNPSLIKSSTNIPGISDHAIIITDMETKPHYQKATPRKRYIYSKANWNKVKEDLQSLEKELRMGYTNRESSENIWQTFKRKLFSSLDENIPSKTIKSNNNLPWINHKVRKKIKKTTTLQPSKEN